MYIYTHSDTHSHTHVQQEQDLKRANTSVRMQKEVDVHLQRRVSAFMERARSQVVNKVHSEDSILGKLDFINDNMLHVQVFLCSCMWCACMHACVFATRIRHKC